jgi:hypothetical protein
MNREELTQLRDILDLLLKCPDRVCEQLVRWFAPEAAKGNGHDPRPLPIATPAEPRRSWLRWWFGWWAA